MCRRSQRASDMASLRSHNTILATIAYVLCSILVVVLYALKRRFIGKITDYETVKGG